MIKFIGRLARLGVRLTMGILPESLISFLIVGSLGVVVHVAVLKTAMAIHDTPFKWANLCAMLVAATFNYLMNNESTFRHTGLAGRSAFFGYFFYLGITSLGMLLSLGVSTHVYEWHKGPILAALAGIVVGSLWNYCMSYTFVWKLLTRVTRAKSPAEPPST
ncbi:MAG TPA: GtrA family protein [Luteibacter sp.]|jgi:dolichol-phosphate mannosyltransferase|uniref:GtrA family protein n=1 Tax=Luteibacter sp. TaxID=1886636 RepID=UPI002F421BF3